MKRALTALIFIVGSVASALATSPLVLSGLIAGQSQSFLTTFTGQAVPLTNTTAGPISALYNGTLSFSAYCVDPTHSGTSAINGTYDVTASAVSGLNNGGRIAYLYNTYSSLVASPPGGSTSAERGGALQIAIWDVLTDGGDGLASGQFRASSGDSVTLSLVTQYLTASVGQSSSSASWYQGQTAAGVPMQGVIGPQAVPEPTTLAGLGLGIVAILRRRKRA